MVGDLRITRNPGGFGPGRVAVCTAGEAAVDTGMDFFVVTARAGEMVASSGDGTCDDDFERAWLLLNGDVEFHYDGVVRAASRKSLFEEDPSCLHVPAGVAVTVKAVSDCELVLFRTVNPARFEPAFFDSGSMLESEHRDRGRWDDAAYRIVRTIFDVRNRPQARLVLGEVVNFPGRWSSYPPHHHVQPEIYHYRFSRPTGYGHSELGPDVFKVGQYDTVRILNEQDHSQVAAPGYFMYYIWAIRHLPGNPYTVPEFTAEHVWLRDIPFCDQDGKSGKSK
jgi:5-deoxy-glucuronate isomerase